MTQKPQVVHVITGLEADGAERFLSRLLEASTGEFDHRVVSLTSLGPIGAELRARGVAVEALGLSMGPSVIVGCLKLARDLRASRPQIVQTWMYHADLIGGLAARLAGVRRLIWGIRHSNLDRDKNKPVTLLVARLCAALSRFLPSLILSNSHAGAEAHIRFGYDARKFRVIPNGFDLERFAFDAGGRERLRRLWGIPDGDLVVGMAGRFDPLKGHRLLFQAASGFMRRHPNVWLVCAGRDVEPSNPALLGWVRSAGVEARTRLIGHQTDLPGLYSAFDLLVMPSAGEGFPNAVGEAMACGRPAVVTDVGDAAQLVDDTGWVTPPGDAMALEEMLGRAAAITPDERAELGRRARARIAEDFSLEAVAGRYATLYRDLLEDRQMAPGHDPNVA